LQGPWLDRQHISLHAITSALPRPPAQNILEWSVCHDPEEVQGSSAQDLLKTPRGENIAANMGYMAKEQRFLSPVLLQRKWAIDFSCLIWCYTGEYPFTTEVPYVCP